MASRDISDLTPRMREKILQLEKLLAEAGLSHFKICCTYRSQSEQNVVWMQGRKNLLEVNEARKSIGLSSITAKQNVKVTWRTVSVHTSREAVDYYVEKDGKYCDDLKVNINNNDLPDWKEFAQIAVFCGLESGYYWDKQDVPHLQWREI
jgi:hypothetical protein